MGIKIKTRSITQCKGYEIRDEIWIQEDGIQTPIKMAYTPSGDRIGDPAMARHIVEVWKISPEKAKEDDSVCSIGFCQKAKKWFGWSHRAICGFGIGDMLFEDNHRDVTDETPFTKWMPFTKWGKVKIKNLEQAKQAAINFARYVS